jgi:hypothetical protein
MAHPELNFDPPGTFTFSNEAVTIEVATTIEPSPPAPPESITVESARLTTPHDKTVDLGITNFEIPPPVVEHVLDQVTSSVASVPNATLSQEGEMVDIAVTDPETFVHVIEGGPALREPVVQGRVEGFLGGPDTLIAIDLALNPPAIGNPDERFIVQEVLGKHLDLNIKIDLESKDVPEVLSYSWGSTNPGQPSEIPPPPVAPPSPDEALSTLTGLTDHPDWWTV